MPIFFEIPETPRVDDGVRHHRLAERPAVDDEGAS